VARRLGGETGLCYLCGLLHDIGKAITLGAAHDVAQIAEQPLGADDYDRLIELFHRDVGRRVIAAWPLPQPVPLVIEGWENYAAAGTVKWESNVVNVAHKLADFTLHEPAMMKRDVFMRDPGFRDLGLSAQDAVQLFDTTAEIIAEMDRYLSP
jgi:HD-like signal output (HDOD) protein